MSKKFIIKQIDEDKDLKYYSEQGWVVKQVIAHEVAHNKVKGIKWDRYHILFERDNEDEDTKKLKALEIIKKKKVNVPLFIEQGSVYNCYIGYEALTQDELDLLKEVLKC